jgi:hypothetical protein
MMLCVGRDGGLEKGGKRLGQSQSRWFDKQLAHFETSLTPELVYSVHYAAKLAEDTFILA